MSERRLFGPRLVLGIACAAIGVVVGLLVLGTVLSERGARRDLDRRFQSRAALTARLIDSLTAATARSGTGDLSTQYANRAISSAELETLVARGHNAYAIVIDQRGRPLRHTAGATISDARLRTAAATLRTGTPYAMSAVIMPRAVVEFSYPFTSGSRQLALVTGVPATSFTNLFSPTLAGGPGRPGARSLILDPAGRILGDSGLRSTAGAMIADDRLAGARASRPGTVVAQIGTSPLRVVLQASPTLLYAPIDGSRHTLAWLTIALVLLVGGGGVALLARVMRAHATQQQLIAKLDHWAHHDQLTGLVNRKRFYELAEARLTRGPGYQSALIFLDLDAFKQINDEHGHQVGDLVLQHVAKRLKAAAPKADAIARIGGDEFAILLCDVDIATAATSTRDLVSATIAQPLHIGTLTLYVQASAGVTIADRSPHIDELMGQADHAMYDHKRRRAQQDQLPFHVSTGAPDAPPSVPDARAPERV